MGIITVNNSPGPGITVTGGGGADVLSGTAGTDTIYGGDGADLIYGANDALYGGDGNDILVATGGAVETGGAGNDIYALEFGNNAVRITDFVAGISGERIRIYGAASYVAAQDGADTKITFSNGSTTSVITLQGVTAAALTSNNVQLMAADRLLPAAPDFLEPTDAGLATVAISTNTTIAAGQTLHFERFAYNILNSINPLNFTNNATVTVTQGYDGLAVFLEHRADGGTVTNSATGHVVVETHADSDNASGITAYGFINNAGTISVVSLHGSATGLGGAITNTGTLTVWAEQTATGAGAAGGHLFSNTGTISVTGHVAVGVSFFNDPQFDNSGTITVTDDTLALDSIAIKIAAFHDATYTNSGTIRGDYAFWVDETRTSPSVPSRETIVNTGEIYGNTLLALGADTVINSGLIMGSVDLGAGNDTYDGTLGVEAHGAIYGGAGADILKAGHAGEALFGGDGTDTLTGGVSFDLLDGGPGDDSLDGGGGQDILSYLKAATAANVDLAAGTAVADGTDSVHNFEIVFGSAFNDTLRGAAGAESLYGGAGADLLDGRDGADILVGDAGDDTETGGAGDDIFVFRTGDGHDVITDFTVGGTEDHLSLYITGGYSLQQQGADTLVVISASDSILLKNVQASSLTTADILTPFGEAPAVGNYLRYYGITTADLPTGPDGSQTVIADGDYTVYTGSPITFSNLALAFKETSQDDTTPTFTNSNTVSITNGGAVTGILGDPYSPNRGYLIANTAGASLTVTGTGTGAAYGIATYGTINNAGHIGVTSADVAYGLSLEAGVLINTGDVTVQGAHYAVGLAADNGGAINNAGAIQVTGGSTVIGVDYFRGGIANSFTNSGLIQATSTGAPSVALRVVADFFMAQHFVNSGTLEGDYAIKVDDTAQSPTSTSIEIIDNSGWLKGIVYLGLGDDELHNSGQITGIVDLGGGNDLYDGTGGTASSSVLGGTGDDRFIGGAGTDNFNGGPGSDTIDYHTAGAGVTVNLGFSAAQNTGGGGVDSLALFENVVGSAFNDVLTGATGDNTMEGGAGDDSLTAGAGNDTASYASASAGVTVSLAAAGAQNTGGAGIDTLSGFENLLGSAFNDSLTGDGSSNIISGGAGNDGLFGGGGDDTLFGGLGDDSFDGGAGIDTVSYADITSGGVSATLGGTQNTGAAGVDTLTGVENLIGSLANDTLTGDGADNRLDGGDGSDALYGGGGADTLIGGPTGLDTLYGGAGADILTGGGGWSNFYGGDGDDTITGGAGNDLMSGGAGNDILNAGGGTNSLTYADITSGGVTVDLNLDTAQNTGAGGIDTLTGFTNLTGSGGADTLTGTGVANTLNGGAGADVIFAGGGNDFVYGGSDGDSLYGDDGADYLSGDEGPDILRGGAGNDFLIGGGGRDIAAFNIAAAAAVITHNQDGSWTVASAAEGTDTVSGVEVLRFTDGDMAIGKAPVVSDFNADGKSDVLWRNDSGEVYVWNSQAGQGAFLGQTLGNPGTSWHVQDTGDYNGDGKADILWRNTAGDLYVYKSNAGAGVAFTGQSISYVDPVWAVVPQSGDFNSDGRADILFRNTSTGEAYVWLSQPSGGIVNFSGQSLGAVPNNWSIQAVGDFNGDARADVLWRSDAGDVYLWLDSPTDAVAMTGQSVSSVGNDWSILGAGDFNGDGRADILWRHAGDGELYVWNSQTDSANVNFLGQSVGVVGLDWSVASIGDYDGDGRADVLFRNADGRVYVWNSNDTGPVAFQGQGLGTTSTDWHILSDFHVM